MSRCYQDRIPQSSCTGVGTFLKRYSSGGHIGHRTHCSSGSFSFWYVRASGPLPLNLLPSRTSLSISLVRTSPSCVSLFRAMARCRSILYVLTTSSIRSSSDMLGGRVVESVRMALRAGGIGICCGVCRDGTHTTIYQEWMPRWVRQRLPISLRWGIGWWQVVVMLDVPSSISLEHTRPRRWIVGVECHRAFVEPLSGLIRKGDNCFA